MESYKINPVSKTLIVSAAFEKAMNNPDSAEYQLYIKLQQDIPGLKVSRRSHKSPTKYHNKDTKEVFYCNQYKNLTYKNMEGFIKDLPKHDELMDVFDFIRYNAALPQRSRYVVVRRWFVAQFPDFRKDPLFYRSNDFAVITNIADYMGEAQEESQSDKESA